jgi:GNAT superfamily N-acetyltransferase
MITTPPPAALTFARADAVIKTPRPVAIIEGIAWAGCLTVVASESGTGKTFVLLSAAAHVSSDVPWLGRAVHQGSVAYLSFEGDALGVRLRALQETEGHRLEHVYVLRPHDPISPRVTREGAEEAALGELAVASALDTLAADLAATQRPPITLLVIDTVRASLSGSEDNSGDVSAYLRAVRRLVARLPGAAALLAHHAGWQDGESQKKRERGSSAWRGNVDCTLYLEAGAYDRATGTAELTLTALKVRDAERPAPLHLIRRRVEVLETEPGRYDPVTTCLIARDPRTRDDRETARQTATAAAHRAADLAVLRAMRDYPAATSIQTLRPYVGQGYGPLSEAVARLLREHLALAGKRGAPFLLTDAGRAALNGTKA